MVVAPGELAGGDGGGETAGDTGVAQDPVGGGADLGGSFSLPARTRSASAINASSVRARSCSRRMSSRRCRAGESITT